MIDFYGFYNAAPYICLVSEMCDKGTLADFISKARVLSRILARRFILELGLFSLTLLDNHNHNHYPI